MEFQKAVSTEFQAFFKSSGPTLNVDRIYAIPNNKTTAIEKIKQIT